MKIKPHIYFVTDFRKIKPGCYVKIKDNTFENSLVKLNGQIVKVVDFSIEFNREYIMDSKIYISLDNYPTPVFFHLYRLELDED